MDTHSSHQSLKQGHTILWVMTIILRRLPFVLKTILGVIIISSATIFATDEYTSTSMFIAESRSSTGNTGIGALAQSFGVSAMGASLGNDSDPPQFYAAVLSSYDFLANIAQIEYVNPNPSDNGVDQQIVRPIDQFSDPQEELAKRLAVTVDALRDKVTTDFDPLSRIITLEVTSEWQWFSEILNKSMLESLNDFNVGKRESRATFERIFTENRLSEAQKELESVEDSLAEFYARNRRIEDSPSLMAEAARTQRRVEVSQQVYLTLSQAYEEARIEEARNTPLITVIDRPEGSSEPLGSILIQIILGALLGLGIAVAYLVFEEFVRVQRIKQSPEYLEFQKVLRQWWPYPKNRP